MRADYNQAVKTTCGNIPEAMRAGNVTAMDAARDAHAVRNIFLISMRSRSSLISLCVAQSLKPAGGSFGFYLEKIAVRRYGKPYVDLTNEEAVMVSIFPSGTDYRCEILTI